MRASCSVPGVYEPTPIGASRFVDGGLHSSTNADLLAPLAFDIVIVSSVMTAVPAEVRLGSRRPTRSWMSRKLGEEVEGIRRTGTPVLVIQPTAAALDVIDQPPSESIRRAVAEIAHRVAKGRLARRDGKGLAGLIAAASA